MKLSVAEAKALLENERKTTADPGWITHGMVVGDTAGMIAQALKLKGVDVDPELVTVQGYVHDIGKRLGIFGFTSHMVDGYNYLKKLGYDEEYTYPCLTHSFVGNDPFCTISARLDEMEDEFVIEFIKEHQFTIGDRILSLCDAMCVFRPLTVEQRLVDIVSRHGVGPGTQKAFQALCGLKRELDEKLGHNLYDLFPEVRENL